jgi:hypothetical protein
MERTRFAADRRIIARGRHITLTVVLRQDRDNHGGILGALALVDGGGASKSKFWGQKENRNFAAPKGVEEIDL